MNAGGGSERGEGATNRFDGGDPHIFGVFGKGALGWSHLRCLSDSIVKSAGGGDIDFEIERREGRGCKAGTG